jgi:hypothetical protein
MIGDGMSIRAWWFNFLRSALRRYRTDLVIIIARALGEAWAFLRPQVEPLLVQLISDAVDQAFNSDADRQYWKEKLTGEVVRALRETPFDMSGASQFVVDHLLQMFNGAE